MAKNFLSPDWEIIKHALPTLAKLVYSFDDEILIDACWAVSYLSDGTNEKIQAVIEAGLPRRLVELLNYKTTSRPHSCAPLSW